MRAESHPARRSGELFSDPPAPAREEIAEGAFVLRGAALERAGAIVAAIRRIERRAPFRNMTTPGGFEMSVAMTSCGECGWITDRTGYRYARLDPLSEKPWPAMPEVFLECAADTASAAGFPGFLPDACLINRYAPGTRLSLHQDKDEADYSWPVVSVSLGLPATFLFGGLRREDKTLRVPLVHGDVVVWGGPARLRYHGVLPVKDPDGRGHPLLGRWRINLTLRKAL